MKASKPNASFCVFKHENSAIQFIEFVERPFIERSRLVFGLDTNTRTALSRGRALCILPTLDILRKSILKRGFMPKEIPISRGHTAIVSDEDFDELSKVKWFYHETRGKQYAMRHETIDGKQRVIYMHRRIMNAPKGVQVDHADNNGPNNQRSNLRLSTHSQNQRNCKIQSNSTTGFKGVTRRKNERRFSAQIFINGKTMVLGRFDKPEDAAKAYDDAARQHFGEYARTNF
jgi:hypothetical protein